MPRWRREERSASAVARDFPFLREREIVRIADFIYVAVNAAKNAHLERLIVGCMPGKLFKLACGENIPMRIKRN